MSSCSATITQDTKSGCRTIICESAGNSIKVMACNKPDGSAQYFEIYRQSYIGSPPKVCLANVCVQNEGYKKSQNYPICTETSCTPSAEICDGKDNDCDNQIDEGNICQSCTPSTEICDSKDNDCNGQIDENVCGQKCYNSVTTIPTTCTSTVTQDTKKWNVQNNGLRSKSKFDQSNGL